jgi:hypothetical protein
LDKHACFGPPEFTSEKHQYKDQKKHHDPMILSSLGASFYKELVVERDISRNGANLNKDGGIIGYVGDIH